MRQINLQCAVCNEVMPHSQETTNHVLHLLLSVITAGLWVPIWILLSIGNGKAMATCTKCGNRRAPGGAATVYTIQETNPWVTRVVIGGVVILAICSIVYANLLS